MEKSNTIVFLQNSLYFFDTKEPFLCENVTFIGLEMSKHGLFNSPTFWQENI